MQTTIPAIFQAILDGDAKLVTTHIQSALTEGLDPGVILNEGMIAAMREVGHRFEAGDYFVPEMLISARAMQTGMSLLKPHLVKADFKSSGKVVIGTVKGDLHDIGKNLVALMLEGAGYEVKDLGADVSPEKFVEAVKQEKPAVVALSALLTTTMPSMIQVIEGITAAGLRGRTKIIVGGAPVTEAYAQQIGADGYSPDASRAVGLVESLLKA